MDNDLTFKEKLRLKCRKCSGKLFNLFQVKAVDKELVSKHMLIIECRGCHYVFMSFEKQEEQQNARDPTRTTEQAN